MGVQSSLTQRSPSVAAVVLNWRDTENTMACLGSLAEHSTLEQIFIVDNETDGSLGQALASPGTPSHTLLEEPANRGFSAGVNVGLRAAIAAKSDYVLVINNDARLRERAVETMLRQFAEDPNVGIVGPAVLNEDGSLQALGPRIGFPLSIDETAASATPDFVTWACVLVSRELLEAVGLLDETFFMYWEDVEFGARTRSAGFRIATAYSALVTHAVSSSHSIAGDRVELYSAYGLGRIAARDRRLLLPSLIRATLRVGKRVATGRFRFAAELGRAYRDGLRPNEQAAFDRVTKGAWPG
ncbi:glycosyltransferase family 2 protein [Plantibacter flavus]|uniref:glycosyltransferase family 2 protein n=1 Tax=Plantibacter flavus TaxID=150123 RepID=UPI003F16F568